MKRKERPTITAHMVVKNEDCWIWFSIMSVIDFVDKMIIFDTGSVDKTKEIIRNIMNDKKYSEKIIFEEFNNITIENFYQLRQKQIDMTDTDYFMIVDGDEIWYNDSLRELESLLIDKTPDLVATRFINCCGDVFHYRNDDRETYNIKGIIGSITIRVYSKSIEGIHCGGDYGVEGFVDKFNKPVQDSTWSIEVMNSKYLHTSLLTRSSTTTGDFSIKYRRRKMKQKWDKQFNENFKYPEVFYMDLPQYVKNPFEKKFNIISFIYHFFRK